MRLWLFRFSSSPGRWGLERRPCSPKPRTCWRRPESPTLPSTSTGLGQTYPQRGPFGQRLIFANLTSVWPNYFAAGAERLIVARVVEGRAELAHYRAAVPGAQPIVCRLTGPLELMHELLRVREPGMNLERALERATQLTEILERAGVEDLVVDNGPGRPVGDVAGEVLSRAGWL